MQAIIPNISISDKLHTEAPYHDFTNGGHISYIELEKYIKGQAVNDSKQNIIDRLFECRNLRPTYRRFDLRKQRANSNDEGFKTQPPQFAMYNR